jgi:hypothetical protein
VAGLLLITYISVMLDFISRRPRLDLAGFGPNQISFVERRGAPVWATGDWSCQDRRQKKDQYKIAAHVDSFGVMAVVCR